MTDGTFKIHSGVPIPPSEAGRPSVFPWKEMRPGDMIEIPVSRYAHNNPGKARAAVRVSAIKALGKGCFATRFNDDKTAVRVWRIK